MSKININLKKLDLVINWDFSGSNQECSLCRRQLISPSLQELNSDTKHLIIEGQVIMGDCGHMFHKECITNFMINNCMLCPIDKTPWKTTKILHSDVVFGDINKVAIKTKYN